MNTLRWVGTALLFAFCCDAPAQTPPQQQPQPALPATQKPPPAGGAATLHQAWIAEVLDLDTKKATALLTQVAQRTGPGNPDRWVAAARLAELHRLGVPGVPSIDLADAPTDIRDAAALPPLDVRALTERVSADPETLYQNLGTEAGRLPPMRAIVPFAESWSLGLRDPTLGELSRRRREQIANRAGFTERNQGYRILEAELDGRRTQADGIRAAHFPGWQPPAVSADPKVNLERFRTNLTSLLNERQLRGYGPRDIRERLGRLRQTVETLAANDEAAAVALLLRLPTFAERLLKETPTQGR